MSKEKLVGWSKSQDNWQRRDVQAVSWRRNAFPRPDAAAYVDSGEDADWPVCPLPALVAWVEEAGLIWTKVGGSMPDWQVARIIRARMNLEIKWTRRLSPEIDDISVELCVYIFARLTYTDSQAEILRLLNSKGWNKLEWDWSIQHYFWAVF